MTPRLRDDLVAATVEEDGVVYVDLTDPATGVNFRFYDFEYELAKQLTGQPVEAVVAWASATYQTDMTSAALDEFVEKLAGLGFLAGSGSGAQPKEISPLSPSSGAAPFAAPEGPSAEPERVELASGPMFGEVSAAPAAPTPVPPKRSPTPLVVAPAASAAPRSLTEGDATEFRLREAASAPLTKGRTLHGLNLAPLTPMTSPGGSDSNAPPPVLPRLQSLGSPLPPLAAELVTGGAEGKRAPPPRPVVAPSGAGAAAPISVSSVLAALSAVPASPPAERAAPSSSASSSPSSSPSLSPFFGDETPFASIAHAIVSKIEMPRGSPEAADALEPGSGASSAGWGEAPAASPPAVAPREREPPKPPTPAQSAPAPATATASAPDAAFRPAPAVVPPAPAAVFAPAPAALPRQPAPAAAAPPPAPAAVLAPAPAAVPPPAPPAPVASPAVVVSVVSVVPVAPASVAVAAAGELPGSSETWASALAHEVERPIVERRQPPAPEVVVMPPVEAAAMAPVPKRRAPLVVGAVLVAGIVGAVVYAGREQPPAPVLSPASPSVHVTVPQPTTIYEWFATPGKVVPGHDDELGFKVAGKLQDVMPPGTTFSAGEAVARLQGVSARELNANRIRARVAFFEQLRDSSHAAGNEAAARQAESNVAARKRDLADAQAKLAEMEIRPAVAGTIGQVLVVRNVFVKAGVPVFKIRAAGPRATFALSADEQAKLRALGFCRVESLASATGASAPSAPDAAVAAAATTGAGEKTARALDCTLPAAAAAASAGGEASPTFAVDLAASAGISPGTQVRLASARFDGVFPIPRAAIVHGAAGVPGDHVWIVSAGTQTAESRAVEVAASTGEQALVTRGLATGDAIIVDPPAGLANGASVNVVH